MLCVNCNVKNICKIYDLIKDKKIKISECEFSYNIFKETIPKETKRKSRMNNDLREIEKKEFGIEEKKREIVACPTCNGFCYDDSIVLCDKCGKFVCDNCGTSYQNKTYCEECYKTL